MRPLSLILPLAALALAACAPDPDPPGEDVASTEGAMASEPGGTASATLAQANTIPEKYRGVWDYGKGSCDPASDLRMEIGPQAIDFYESHGDVASVKPGGKDGIIVTLRMEGEGEEWTAERRLDLSADGKTLTPSDAQAPADHKPMPLIKCPA